jgi:hypothetical protein
MHVATYRLMIEKGLSDKLQSGCCRRFVRKPSRSEGAITELNFDNSELNLQKESYIAHIHIQE